MQNRAPDSHREFLSISARAAVLPAPCFPPKLSDRPQGADRSRSQDSRRAAPSVRCAAPAGRFASLLDPAIAPLAPLGQPARLLAPAAPAALRRLPKHRAGSVLRCAAVR